MASKKRKDYFGLGGLVSLILVILPPTAWICGMATRLKEGHILAFVVRIFLGFNILWIVDIIFMLLHGKICRAL